MQRQSPGKALTPELGCPLRELWTSASPASVCDNTHGALPAREVHLSLQHPEAFTVV